MGKVWQYSNMAGDFMPFRTRVRIKLPRCTSETSKTSTVRYVSPALDTSGHFHWRMASVSFPSTARQSATRFVFDAKEMDRRFST